VPGSEHLSALPKFTPVTFTSALGCGQGSVGNVVGDPGNGDTLSIEKFADEQVLTSVVVGSQTVSIEFIG
jgi:hypothetical protein